MVMTTSSRTSYPHVTNDAGVRSGQPCIAETGVRVTELASANEKGTTPSQLTEHFMHRDQKEGGPVRHLTLAEVFAGLAYYHDNIDSLELVRVEDERLAGVAKVASDAAILKFYSALS